MLGNNEQSRIERTTAFFMIAVALLIDGLQFLLTIIIIGFLINPIISIMATMLFGIWMSHHGVSMMSSKYALRFLGTIVGETILGTLPIWTVTVAVTVFEGRVKEVIHW